MSFNYGPNYKALVGALQQGGTDTYKAAKSARQTRGLGVSPMIESLGEKIEGPQSTEQAILARFEKVKKDNDSLKERMKELGIEQDPVTEELEPPVEDPDVNTSGDIIDFIAGFEGFRETAYDDYGQLTIGFGTPATSADQTITREDAMKELSKEVMKARTIVLEAAKEFGYDWSDNQVDALTSFTFNLGQGNFNRLLKGDEGGLRGDEEISEMILEYNKAGGEVLPGLTKRRQAEADLFTQGYNS
jgi:lysozyme